MIRLMVCPRCAPTAYYDPDSPPETRCVHCNTELVELRSEVPTYLKSDLAKAWDEGWDAASVSNYPSDVPRDEYNPYREAR